MAPRSKPTSRSTPAHTAHVALLRGINVGGKNLLPMAKLAALFSRAGCSDVGTYIQSGNVIFGAPAGRAKEIAKQVTEIIAKDFGYRVPVLVRSAEELREIAGRHPFRRAGDDPSALHVTFLADVPAVPHVLALDAGRSPGDSFQVIGREIYLHLPGGVEKTKLTNAYFDAALHTTSTFRNWRTVLKLIEMADALG